MPFLNGNFTRLRNWQADKAAGLDIQPDLMDQDANDIALGLSSTMLRDGTSTATADLPMGGHKLTGLGAAAVAGDALSLVATGANTILAGPVSGTPGLPSYRGLVPADLPATTQIVTTRTAASDFTTNGSYFEPLAVAFTAMGSKAKLTGAITFNHQNPNLTTIRAYVDLYDNTAQALVGAGVPLLLQLSSSGIQLGSLSPLFGAAGLTLGHSYIARLWIQRDTANGPTGYTCDLAAENL